MYTGNILCRNLKTKWNLFCPTQVCCMGQKIVTELSWVKNWILAFRLQWSRVEPTRSGSCLRTALADPRGRILGRWRGILQRIWWDYHGLSHQRGRTTAEPLYRCDMKKQLSCTNNVTSMGKCHLNCKWLQLDHHFFFSVFTTSIPVDLFCLYCREE